MYITPAQGLTLTSVLRGILGICVLLFIACLLSKDRKKIDWKIVVTGLSLQILLAFGMLYIPALQIFFEFLGKIFVKILEFTRQGTAFLAGGLLDTSKVGYIFIFQVLPTLIFFSALISLLYYLNIIQRIVQGVGWCIRKIFRLSGSEGLTVAGNIFLGMCEAPILVKRYLPTARLQFAKYLISASVMAAPGAIVFSKIIIPQTEPLSHIEVSIPRDKAGKNILDAISNGAIEGLKLAVTVAALLLVFIAMVALLNYLLGDLIGHYTGLNRWLSEMAGHPVIFNFQTLIGWIFTPIAWIMGVCNADTGYVGSLLGTKIVLNEFVAYADLNILKNAGTFIQEKSIIIATFALCGFANISSIGMQIGGIGVLAPDQRKTLTRYGFLAMICGTLASCMSATIVGMIIG